MADDPTILYIIGAMSNVVIFDEGGAHTIHSHEQMAIDAVLAAARAAFSIRESERGLTQRQVVDIACALATFLKHLEELPNYHRPIDVREWRQRIENLRLHLGPPTEDTKRTRKTMEEEHKRMLDFLKREFREHGVSAVWDLIHQIDPAWENPWRDPDAEPDHEKSVTIEAGVLYYHGKEIADATDFTIIPWRDPNPKPPPVTLTRQQICGHLFRTPLRVVGETMTKADVYRFPLGEIVATAGADGLMSTSIIVGERFLDYLRRHARGDWGFIDDSDKDANNQALTHGGRLLSAYPIFPDFPCEGSNRLWIITEADRSATTFLLPSEY